MHDLIVKNRKSDSHPRIIAICNAVSFLFQSQDSRLVCLRTLVCPDGGGTFLNNVGSRPSSLTGYLNCPEDSYIFRIKHNHHGENMLSLKDGELAIKLARKSIERYLNEHTTVSPKLSGKFMEKRGVFVTLHKEGLRGCIGQPYPDMLLGDAIVDSAISAAIRDPRFPPVQINELDDITIEITILAPPKLIEGKTNERPEKIQIGKHGLLVKFATLSGLLLPQVATEYGLDAKGFLSQTCIKAGLTPDMWLDGGVEVYTFEGQIFAEVEPNGAVVEKKIT